MHNYFCGKWWECLGNCVSLHRKTLNNESEWTQGTVIDVEQDINKVELV